MTQSSPDIEQRIAVLSDALKSISKNTCCDNCREAANVARSALASYVGLARDAGLAQRLPMAADIAQLIDDGWRNGKSSHEVAADIILECEPSVTSPRDEPQTLSGQIAAIYGNLDAEDCTMIDRAWIEWRGRGTITYALSPSSEVTTRAINLGDLVCVNEQSPYFHEWKGAKLKVVSLRVDPDGKYWVSVIEGEQRHRANGVYDGETTDFDADHLTALALSRPERV